MAEKTTKRLKAEEAIFKYPSTGNSNLADILVKEYPLLYDNKEDARQHLRRARGSHGAADRKPIKEVKHFKNGTVINPYALPEQEKQRFVPYNIKVDEKTRVAVLPDLHLPFSNNAAVTTALDHLKKYKPTHIILNGDILDCYQLSTFEKRPDERDFKYEIDVARNFLEQLSKTFSYAKIIYKFGNHDERWEKFLWRKAPEVWGFEEFHLEKMLRLKEYGIEAVKYKRLIHAGKIVIVHGHEFQNSNASVIPARSFYLKSQTNVIGSHTHQISEYSCKDLKGNSHVAYSTGCLCLLNPDYAPINNWNHGFATIDFLNKDGDFRVNNYKIIGNNIY